VHHTVENHATGRQTQIGCQQQEPTTNHPHDEIRQYLNTALNNLLNCSCAAASKDHHATKPPSGHGTAVAAVQKQHSNTCLFVWKQWPRDMAQV